ncbi:MAG TPA: hypothetical protein VNY74_07115 [Edaphobacter sp.]|jgi:hypothetical protein|nr:hypothetical protein [Edaphobacter sp.]
MAGTFAGYEIVASTKNFLITCEDDVVARNQATAIGYICESDLDTLQDLFSTEFQYDKTIDHGVWVNVLKDDPARTWNGQNHGYETEESSRIIIGRAFTPPPPPPPTFVTDPPAVPGPNYARAVIEFPQRVFVAELVEILMGFTGYGWNAGYSNGEALSGISGALLHPYGYYPTGQGPRVNQWLNGGRPDFVSKTDPTDQNFVTFGCGILFINYLVHQLGFDLKAVIRAGGDTLAETYHRLTGKPASSAFDTFIKLINAHVDPAKQTFVAVDNIFPLYDLPRRTVSIDSGGQVTQIPVPDPKPHSFPIRPGLFCPEKPYDFLETRSIVEAHFYAHCTGLLNAGFAWQIDGNNISTPSVGNWGSINLNTPVTVRNPDRTVTAITNSTTLQYFIRYSWNSSELFLKNTDIRGNCSVTLGVFCEELGIANDPQISTTYDEDLVAVTWSDANDQLSKDRRRCNPFYAAVDKSIWGLSATLSDAKNRPDPPSERGLKQVIDAVSVVLEAAGQYAEGAHLTRAEVLQQLNVPGALRSPFEPLSDRSLRSAQQQVPQQSAIEAKPAQTKTPQTKTTQAKLAETKTTKRAKPARGRAKRGKS